LQFLGPVVNAQLELMIWRSKNASEAGGSFFPKFCQLLLEHASGLSTSLPKEFTKHILFVKVLFEGTAKVKGEKTI
jgi:hypothetical protein